MSVYGCWNTARKDWFYVRDHGYSDTLDFDPIDMYRPLVDTSTKDCKYRKTTTDKKCEGCSK